MPSTASNRPKPDAGHLGHLRRPAPILSWMGTRESPPPECRSGRKAAEHPTHVLTSHTRSQASPVPSGAGPGNCQAEHCACPFQSPRQACQFLFELQPEGCGEGPAGRPAAPLPSAWLRGSSLSLAPAVAAAPTSGSPGPAPSAAANGAGAGLMWPRPPDSAGWVSRTPTTNSTASLGGGAGL